MSKEILSSYILIFHDNGDLYIDILFRLNNALNKDAEELKDMFSEKAQELLESYGYNDGSWELIKIENIDEIEVLTLE